MNDTSRLQTLQMRFNLALRNGLPSQLANDPSVTVEKPRSDGIWKSLIGTIIGGFISSATAYCTNIQGYEHQAQAAREEKHDQSLKLRVALLAELKFEQSQLGSGLIDHSQKMTAAAIQIADMKVWAQRS